MSLKHITIDGGDDCIRTCPACLAEVKAQRVVSPPPTPDVERLKAFREQIEQFQAGTRARSKRRGDLIEVAAAQGTLAVILAEFDKAFPEVVGDTPTPGGEQP